MWTVILSAPAATAPGSCLYLKTTCTASGNTMLKISRDIAGRFPNQSQMSTPKHGVVRPANCNRPAAPQPPSFFNKLMCRPYHQIVGQFEMHNRLGGNIEIPVPGQSCRGRSRAATHQAANNQSDSARGHAAN